MEEILLIALIVGAGYFLLIQQKKSTNNQPLTNSQSTQTEPLIKPINDNKSLEKTVDNLITNIRQLNHSLK